MECFHGLGFFGCAVLGGCLPGGGGPMRDYGEPGDFDICFCLSFGLALGVDLSPDLIMRFPCHLLISYDPKS